MCTLEKGCSSTRMLHKRVSNSCNGKLLGCRDTYDEQFYLNPALVTDAKRRREKSLQSIFFSLLSKQCDFSRIVFPIQEMLICSGKQWRWLQFGCLSSLKVEIQVHGSLGVSDGRSQFTDQKQTSAKWKINFRITRFHPVDGNLERGTGWMESKKINWTLLLLIIYNVNCTMCAACIVPVYAAWPRNTSLGRNLIWLSFELNAQCNLTKWRPKESKPDICWSLDLVSRGFAAKAG